MKSKVVAEALGMMVTSFGLVAALAWNEAVKTLISELLPKGQGILSLFVYAIVVTAAVVIISSRIIKIRSKFEEEGEQK